MENLTFSLEDGFYVCFYEGPSGAIKYINDVSVNVMENAKIRNFI